MFDYFRDRWQTARLKARCERLVQERMLHLAERTGPQPVAPDPGRWLLVGDSARELPEAARDDLRTRARRLVRTNPHACQVLRLLETYVAGPGLMLDHVPRPAHDPFDPGLPPDPADDDRTARSLDAARRADRLWETFLERNERHFSWREFARRTWRDGECFLRIFPRHDGPPDVRFVDPESIAGPPEHPESLGILTAAADVETPVAYLRTEPGAGRTVETIEADRMLHAKIGADSNQKRGTSLFAPLVESCEAFDRWLETELAARKLQASIVLWRKVQGPPSQAAAVAEAAADSCGTDGPSGARRERYRPGSIVTTSGGTDLRFLQPDTNFGDAVPLGRLLLLCLAAGAGVPEFMLTSDASNGNFASTMVAEGPAVKLFRSEQQFFAGEFARLWRIVCGEAVRSGALPQDFFELVRPRWTFPALVVRDRATERTSEAKLVEARILSRAEVARRDGVDPTVMRSEIARETAAG